MSMKSSNDTIGNRSRDLPVLLDVNKDTNQKVKGEKMKCGTFLYLVTTKQSIKNIKIT
jgi:hypothetical protein